MGNRKITVLRLVFGLLTCAVCGLLFFSSATSGSVSSRFSTGITFRFLEIFAPGFKGLPDADQIAMLESVHFLIRKAAHFGCYMTLGIFGSLFAWSMSDDLPLCIEGQWHRYLFVFCFSVLYAVSDELHQLLVPERSCEIRDVGIDAAGAFIGIALVVIVLCAAGKRRRKSSGVFSETE